MSVKAFIEELAEPALIPPATAAFGDLQVDQLTKDNFVDEVAACGCKMVAKCPASVPAVEVEGFVLEMTASLWMNMLQKSTSSGYPQAKFGKAGGCPLRDMLSRLRVSSEFGPRESAFLTKYFYYFGKMRSHEGMMNDLGRSETYRKAIQGNPDNFKDKIIMDVGSGSGLLAFFAIQAGAKKVYAVEAGNMHSVIRTLADANGWGDRIVVINKVLQDMTEDDCPGNSVDTIVAETLGTFLFGERGIETMLVARDRFLKKDGAIFPTQATLSMAPFSDRKLYENTNARTQFWTGDDFFGIKLSSVADRARREQFSQVLHCMVDPDCLAAKQVDVVYDFRTLNQADLRQIHTDYSFTFPEDTEIHGLAGWFVADFIGSNQKSALSTSPFDILTHWFQVRMLIPEPLSCVKGETLKGTIDMQANEQQTYDCKIDMTLDSKKDGPQRRQNDNLNLMDLDSTLKSYEYKIVTHGNVQVAAVDWVKTTEEARARWKAAKNASTSPDTMTGREMAFNDKIFVCVDCPDKFKEYKQRQRVIIGKIGEKVVVHGIKDDKTFKYGLLRVDGNKNEESFWLQTDAYTELMMEYIIKHKSKLAGAFSTTDDAGVRAHFKQLTQSQMNDCYQGLRKL